MLKTVSSIINSVSGFLYMPWVPLFLVIGGFYCAFRTKFVQIRYLGESFKVVSEKPKDKKSVSSFGALMVSTASRVGTGNIIGVSTAICFGGPGAIFWMWVIALIGGASAFVESTLAQIFKKKHADNSFYGGPSHYMQQVLKARWLGVVFAVIIILTYAVGYNALASFNLQSAFSNFSFYGVTTPYVIGAILAVLFLFCVMGGAKKLTRITGLLVPIMGIIYVVVSIIVILLNLKAVPEMFKVIFVNAFDFESIFAGFGGSCLMYGVKRGLYSNEAGMGSAPNAAATADVSHPVKQGLVQMLSVFIDTILICTATAFMCLLSGVAPTAEDAGAVFVQKSLSATFGSFGPIFIAISMTLFAFTTLIGNFYYCEGCLHYILGKRFRKVYLQILRLVGALVVFAGAIVSMGLVWDTADLLQALMVIINVPVIVIIAKPAILALKDYQKQKKEGKDPCFVAKDAGIQQETECW